MHIRWGCTGQNKTFDVCIIDGNFFKTSVALGGYTPALRSGTRDGYQRSKKMRDVF